MIVDLPADITAKARLPHNIFMLNLALFHLLMTPASIALEIGISGMLVPLMLSLAVITYTYIKSRKLEQTAHWFVLAHWKLAVKRYRILLISYAVTATLILIGWLLAMSSPDPHMQNILQTVFIRIAIMPVLLIVMVNFYLESSAISMTSRGEVPDTIINMLPESAKNQCQQSAPENQRDL